MNALRGWLAALGSMLLASAAQLGMRWGMSRLPLPEAWAGQTPERAALLAVA
ncbi:TPA: 4-amino-4-deoxy-L-arabinose-phospho-UDP flippase, partial [Pseudomonas aeruginosa]|nr:4-amino-4-deoxy-L-arabinose-phospho-UDP flippase [Pseudomonas aeruginosa]